ncbi:MAG TPA: carboxypeptidase M32 [Vicinamibacterales bacterium]|nr:carboxypeptidase M32 [Vicinamibacterales bacterium]
MIEASTAVDRLNALVGEIVNLRRTAVLIEWDERVSMPPGGVALHGEMAATIQRLAHEKFTSARLGSALQDAAREVASLPPDSQAARLVRVTTRDYHRAVRVPSEFVAEQAHVSSAAHQAWKEARAQSNYEMFQPHLEKVVRLEQQFTTFFQPVAHPYDALIDTYEPGMLTSEVQSIFDVLRPRQVELVRAIQKRPAKAASFLEAHYDEGEMLAFATHVVSAFGFDWSRGRQDKSTHPFAAAIGSDDVRITTRFDNRHPFEMLFAAMHEAGHALYEQGVSSAWAGTLIAGGASQGVHESQSRLWENIIGRSRPFWQHFFPDLQRRFPSQLSGVTVDQFHNGINQVKRSLIRVEADEVTYNLHVMLRVEIEIALLTGAISTKEVSEYWNAKMLEYLGIMPDSDANGILQDMHWSIGVFGYFATYTLGNLMSVQLWNKYTQDDPRWAVRIEAGEFGTLREWLRSNLHQHGRSYQPRELAMRITGKPISTAPYLAYLESKYA